MTKPSWYIDAFDAPGGLAFASHRPPDLTDPEPALGGPAWVISAPDFQPQALSSRAIGFAASQRGLQLGLSLDGLTEVAFPSLPALAEYVRRLFMAGGGNDGAGGVTPSDDEPPDSPDGGERELFEPQSAPDPLVPYKIALCRFAEIMSDQSTDLARTDSCAKSLAPLKTPPPPETPDGGPGPLDLADKLITAELSYRWSAMSQDDKAARLDLSVAIQSHVALSNALLLRNIVTTPPNPADDLLDLLARIPIPPSVARSTNGQVENWRSLKDLLFGLLANTSLLLETEFVSERVVLFLFAAAMLVNRGRSHGLLLGDDAKAAAAKRMMENVFGWLREELPKVAFTAELEDQVRAMHRPE